MYLGDSVHDDDAFDLAEIPVGVPMASRSNRSGAAISSTGGSSHEMLDRLARPRPEFTPSIVKEMTGGRVR